MPGEPWLSRDRFDTWVRDHDSDPDCHGAALRELRAQIVEIKRFQERLVGGFMVLSAIVASGAVAAAIELLVIRH